MVGYVHRNLLNSKYNCSLCGKPVYRFNMSKTMKYAIAMEKEHICWECAYWKKFLNTPHDDMDVISGSCYRIFPFIEKEDRRVEQILGGGGKKTYYILRRNGECFRSNDVWWINVIPSKYRLQLKPTAWWVTKNFWKSLKRSMHKCKAVGCMDRYHCYRYQYQLEFDKEPYNHVPKDWIVGSEHCPAFLNLKDIKDYDEYVKPSDIIDEGSVRI